MKHAMWIFLVIYTACAVIACSKKGGSGGSGNDPGIIVPPTAPCTGGCAQSNGPVSFNSENLYQNSLQITNNSVFRKFMKEAMALCDQGDLFNYGWASCDSYTGGYVRLTLQAPAAYPMQNNAMLTISVLPRSMPNWGLVGNIGGGGIARNPMQLQLSISMINGSTYPDDIRGIEGRSYGGYGTIAQRKLMQLQVPEGKMQDGYMDYRFAYNGQGAGSDQGGVFIEGRLNRCADVACTSY